MISKAMRAQMKESFASRESPNSADNIMRSTVFGQMAEQSEPPTEIPVASVVRSPYQRRITLDMEHVKELAESIGTDGLLEPIIVRKVGDAYEHIAGLHRLEAYKLLGIAMIPAHVRTMSNAQAARALTLNNTQHKAMTDFELYLHAVMLREQNAVKNVSDLSNVLGLGRGTIYNIEAFGELPEAALGIIEKRPEMVGGNVAFKLKKFSKEHAELVTQAVQLIADEKLGQYAAAEWVEKKLKPAESKPVVDRRDMHLGDGDRAVRIAIAGNEAKLVGDLDYEKVWRLIESNLDSLRRG